MIPVRLREVAVAVVRSGWENGPDLKSPTKLPEPRDLAALESLRLMPLWIRARARDEIPLPPFSGSTLRGALGHALLDSVCVVSHRECAACRLVDVCSYPYLFETSPGEGARRLKKQPFVPHPYVLVPPPGGRSYARGEPFEFGLTLIGRATELLPTVVSALLRMGERGLTRGRACFDIESIDQVAPGNSRQLVAGDPPGLLRGAADLRVCLADYLQLAPLGVVDIRFESPVRLLRDGRLLEDVPFDALIRALLRRATSLMEFHEGVDLELDFRGLIREAETVRLLESDLSRTDRLRFSVRQGRAMNLTGLCGRVRYQGRLEPFRSLLALGAAVGVGKGTTFGLGRLRLGATSGLPNRESGY